MKHPRTDVLAKGATFKKTNDRCKKVKQCPYCHAINGTVKKITGAPTLKIVHECYKGRQAQDELEGLSNRLEHAMTLNKDIQPLIESAGPPIQDLLPQSCWSSLRRSRTTTVDAGWIH
ncbi:DNA dependent RNA polymerase [Fragilaria crotonensis]|nr:DNA dependent RNA polymerase [Fragilaria crotonensis]